MIKYQNHIKLILTPKSIKKRMKRGTNLSYSELIGVELINFTMQPASEFL